MPSLTTTAPNQAHHTAAIVERHCRRILDQVVCHPSALFADSTYAGEPRD